MSLLSDDMEDLERKKADIWAYAFAEALAEILADRGL
jgi:hypothetical protein